VGANARSKATYEHQANAHGETTLTVMLNAYGKASAMNDRFSRMVKPHSRHN